LTISANQDVTGAPTIKGVENINVNIDAVVSGTDTDFAFAATNIADGATLAFNVVAPITAVSSLTLTGLGSQTVVAGSNFTTFNPTLASTSKDLTATIKAAGSVGSPVSSTVTSGKNVQITAAGSINVTAATAAGLVKVAAVGNATVSAAAAPAVIVTSSGNGNITLSDNTAASLISASTGGNITATAAAAIVAATNVSLLAGGTVTATNTGTSLKSITLAGTGTANTLTDTGASLVELSVSGNGAAATFAVSGHDKLNTVNVTGSNNVVVSVNASKIDGLTSTTGYGGAADTLALRNTGTGTAQLKLATAAGNADLSKSVGLTSVKLAVDNATKTITLPASTTLTVSAAQAGATQVNGPAATNSTNSLAITLDDGSKASGVADFATTGELLLVDLKTVTIDASVDTASDGSSNAHSFFKITGTDENANVTINGGVNAINLAHIASGAISLGTGTLTVNGTGAVAVTHATGTLSAGAFDASAKTAGVVTAANLSLAATSTFKTGAGADAITLGAANSSGTGVITSGAGNDTITIGGSVDYSSAGSLSIDFGDGTDTLVLTTGAKLQPATDKTVAVTGLEVIDFASATAAVEVGASLLNGAAYSVQNSGTAASGNQITVKASSATTIDLSKLVASSDSTKSVSALTYIVDVSAKSSGYTILGAVGSKNTFTGGTGADSLVGGTKADNISAADSDTITGGTGNDTFNLTSASGATATKFVTVTDYAVSTTAAVDTLVFTGSTGGALAATLTGYTASNGIFTKSGATVADFVTAVQAAESGGAVKDVYAFSTGSDVYVYSTGASKTVLTDDVMVKLTGIGAVGIGIEMGGFATAGYIQVS